MVVLNYKSRWAQAVLMLVLVCSLCIVNNNTGTYADNRTAVTLSEYETLVTGKDGQKLVRAEFPSRPPLTRMPAHRFPTGLEKSLSGAVAGSSTNTNVTTLGTTTVLANVPAFDWSYGCSATMAAMLFGYYDRSGYSNMYSGPANGGVCPMYNSVWGYKVYPSVTCWECPLSATHSGVDGRTVKGHVDDYWVDYNHPGPDPYVSGGWEEHAQGDCTADFMGTSQARYGLRDGSTYFWWNTNGDPLYDYTGHDATQRDGCHGMRLFAQSRGYTVTSNFTQLIRGQGTDPNKGFTFADFQAEINAGRPVHIIVTGHSMLGYGYDSATNTIYIRDTWDFNSHTMTWGGSYSGMQHRGVSVVRLAPPVLSAPGAPSLASPASNSYVSGTSIPFTWTAPAGATAYWLTVRKVSDGSFVINQPVGNVNTYTVAGFPNNGAEYRWAVAAGNSAGWTSSAYQHFINGPLAAPAAPVLSSPASGAAVNGSSINFRWNAVTGATGYWLTVRKASDNSIFINKAAGNLTSLTEYGFPDDGTQYIWAVGAGNSAGWTASAYRPFTSGTATKPAAPTLNYPAPGATVSGAGITFAWSASTGATAYWLTVQKVSDGSYIINQPVGNVTSRNVTGFPNDGTQYRWAVAAGNSAGWTASAWRTFTSGP